MNILIIKTGALGDVVRTSFIAQALKDRYKFQKLRLYWLTHKKATAFFINNPYVDEVVIQEKRDSLKNINFDLIINLEEDEDNCKFVNSLKYKKIIGAFLNKRKIDYTSESKEWFDMSLISKLGKEEADILKKKNQKTHRQIMSEIIDIKNYQKYVPFLRLTNYQRKYAQDFLRVYNFSPKELIIGVYTGSADRWPKQLSVKKTIELINNLHKNFKNARILLFGGPSETERNREIIAKSKTHVIDTGVGTDLVELPALISLCKLFITCDTLALHLSLALRRKTICLIGPTSPKEIDMYDLGEKIIADSKCICCYKKDCKSMDKINIEKIIDKSKQLLEQKATILVTSFKEPNVWRAIESLLKQKTNYEYDIIVSAPDDETKKIVETYSKKNKRLKFFRDPGKGKVFALNLVFQELKKTDILILTDGDVYTSENSVEDILNLFQNPEIGCLSGRPVPQENKNTKYGYWANFLFDSAHKIRKKAFDSNSFLECSGYLFAFRKNFISKIPTDVAEDTVIPYLFWEKGYKIGYVDTARVFVKNADNLKDWIKQKLRTHKSHGKLGKYVDVITTPKVKSFKTEIKGFWWIFLYPFNLKEFFWGIELVFARFYTWIRFFLDTHIFDRHYTDAWERVGSTK